MMRKAGWVTLLMCTVALAGCADDPEPQQDEDPVTLVTDPTDLEGGNTQGAHIHDYWGGQDRLTLMEEQRENGIGGEISSCDGFSWEVFLPPDQKTVHQGTQYVEVTFTWEDEPGTSYTDPELWLKTANSTNAAFVADAVSGQTIVFESTNAHNDLPHQLLSAWEFHWYIHPEESPANPTCDQRHIGTVSIQVEIVKGLDIPLFPGHPDRWDNATELPLLDERRSVFWSLQDDAEDNGMCLTGNDDDGGCFWDDHRPDEGAIIPHDADHIEVTLTHEDDPDNGPLALAYHGADTREVTVLDPSVDAGDSQTFTIPVQGNGDGPYALQSLWEFRVFPEDDAYWDGAYTITATVYRNP